MAKAAGLPAIHPLVVSDGLTLPVPAVVTDLLPPVCPLCGRTGTLMMVSGTEFCAACGYASDGISGCT